MTSVSTSMVALMILGILMIASTSLTKATNTSQSFEGEALLRWKASLELYTDTLGSWNTTSPCDNWYGITCNAEGRVTGIHLSDFYLKGTLYSLNFSSFPSLSTLALPGHHLFGKIPHDICTLSQLTHLDLSSKWDNYYYYHYDPKYSGKLSGQLPLSFSNLTKLTYLNLFGNLFEGEVPLPLSSKLIYLNLSHNGFSGKLPLSFTNITKLNLLDLSHNHFDGEVSLPFSHKFTHIDLSNNSFSGQLPPSLLNCLQLVTLRLSYNQFSGRIPSEYGDLRSLTEFSLDHNQISGAIPVEVMNLQSLVLLDLSNNRITGPIPSMLSLSYLNFLHLDTNEICGPIPHEIGNLYQLVKLELQGNNISGELQPEIGKLSNLNKLNLSDNNLQGTIPSQIGNLVNLVDLDISGNLLTGIVPHQLANMVNLEYLNLSHNKLSGAFECFICRMTNLQGIERKIDLSSNNFKGQTGYTYGLVDFMNGPCADYYIGECPSAPKMHKVLKCIVVSYISSALFLMLSIFGIHYFCRKQKMKMEEEKKGNLLSIWIYDGRMAYEDIIASTQDFDLRYCIGVGGYGSVYKAVLPSGKVVALKKLHQWEAQEEACKKSFENEIKFLTTIRHRNIVRLYGFCTNRRCTFLIYEYMEKGSLYCVLSNEEEAVELDWSKQVNVVKCVSYALSYMHHDCNPPILDRDISSNNILFTSELEACVSDFGTARLIQPDSSNQTIVVGTYGYIAPGNFPGTNSFPLFYIL